MTLDTADQERLANSSLFRRVDLAALAHLLESCTVQTIEAGVTLLEAEVQHHTLYIVLEGELRVYLSHSDAPAHAVLGPGDCVGELSLIDGQGASALVIAAAPTRVWAIAHDLVWSLVENSHGVARNLLSVLSGRVRSNNLILVAAQGESLEFEQAISVDALTGLHNRQWLTTSFPRSLERCQRDDQPACLVLAEVDFLAALNERFGYLMGDHALRCVAGKMSQGLRSQDFIARYSAEEFMILLPRTAVSDGLAIAERLRESVANDALATVDGPHTVTISCGVAAQADGESFADLVQRVETALRRAKDKGRNRIELAPLN